MYIFMFEICDEKKFVQCLFLVLCSLDWLNLIYQLHTKCTGTCVCQNSWVGHVACTVLLWLNIFDFWYI